MNGNIYDDLGTMNGKKTVAGEGWLAWDDGDASAVYLVTVTQNGTAGSSASTPVQRNGAVSGLWIEWDVPVPANGSKFKKGTAHATFTATVAVDDGGSDYVVTWGKDVELD
jgi:hypothetical protein